MDTINITNAKSGEILIWDGKVAMWKNMSDVESERLRKERKEKLEKINDFHTNEEGIVLQATEIINKIYALQYKLQ